MKIWTAAGEGTLTEYRFRGASFRFLDAGGASHLTFDDEQEVRDRWWHIEPDEVVLDVGAAFGSYAFPAAALGAKVYAWSPEDPDASIIEQSLMENTFPHPVTVYRTGVYSRDGWLAPASQRFSAGGPLDKDETWIQVETLDSWVSRQQLDRIDWIKLDVEGAEVEVLKGALCTITKYCPKLLVENHLFKDAEIQDKVMRLVSSLGLGYGGTAYPYHAISHSLLTTDEKGRDFPAPERGVVDLAWGGTLAEMSVRMHGSSDMACRVKKEHVPEGLRALGGTAKTYTADGDPWWLVTCDARPTA